MACGAGKRSAESFHLFSVLVLHLLSVHLESLGFLESDRDVGIFGKSGIFLTFTFAIYAADGIGLRDLSLQILLPFLLN